MSKKYTVLTEDKIVRRVIQDLDLRSVVGVDKYKTTLQKNNHDDFFKHLLEELLDAANYVKKLQIDSERKVGISAEGLFLEMYDESLDSIDPFRPEYTYKDMLNFAKGFHKLNNSKVDPKVLPNFLYEDDGEIKVGVNGDSTVTNQWEEYINLL